MNTVALIVGLIAAVLWLLSYQQKKRIAIILFNATSRGLFILQYILLGAFSGAILDVLGVLSSVVAGKKHVGFIKKHTRLLFVVINLATVLIGLFIAYANQSWLDLFPIVGVTLQTSAFWLTSEKRIRWISLIGTPFWFVYNFTSGAYGTALCDILTICSIIIAMIKYRNMDAETENT